METQNGATQFYLCVKAGSDTSLYLRSLGFVKASSRITDSTGTHDYSRLGSEGCIKTVLRAQHEFIISRYTVGDVEVAVPLE